MYTYGHYENGENIEIERRNKDPTIHAILCYSLLFYMGLQVREKRLYKDKREKRVTLL